MKSNLNVIVQLFTMMGALLMVCLILGCGSSTSPDNQEPEEPEEPFRIVSVETKVVETNDTWHKYSWKLMLENLTNRSLILIATLQWLDADSFVIDEYVEYDIHLASLETETFRGLNLILMPEAANVETIHATVKERAY